MIRLDFKALAIAIAGRLVDNRFAAASFTGVSIDSRTVDKDMLFVAIVGEKNDGHKYIKEAMERGCAGLLISDESILTPTVLKNIAVVVVDDTHRALIDLAIFYRRKVDGTYIAITGSNGKTTTKDITYDMIKNRDERTYRSGGNLNNLYGLPLSILAMPEGTRYGVFELGISVIGEMARLAKILQPDVAVITNVGPTHLETLGTVEKVASEKFALVDNTLPACPAIINLDDARIAAEASRRKRPFLTFGLSGAADVSARKLGVDKNGYLQYRLMQRTFVIPAFGDYQIYNVLAGAAVCQALGFFPTEEELNGLDFNRTPHRGQIRKFDDLTVIDDCYNANPVSMTSGLKSFRRYVNDAHGLYKRTIVILGDMLELGPGELDFHRDIGRMLPELKIDVVCTVGKLASQIGKAAIGAGLDESRVHHFTDAREAGEFMTGNVLTGDIVYLKASRGIALEKIFDVMKERAAQQN